MPLAIQETLLPGNTLLEKLKNARSLGFEGVEFPADGLGDRVPQIVEGLQQTGLRPSAVNLGRRDGYIAPELNVREAAISALREAMADSVDIGAHRVIFVPHFGAPRMPDLTPYRAPVELAGEMMIWLLRGMSDLAYAIGIELDMQPRNRDDTYFMNRLEHAVFFRQKIKDHPHVMIAPHLFHMAGEESDPVQTLRKHAAHIAYLHLADSNGGLPGTGDLDFEAIANVLRENEYAGWVTLAGETGGTGDVMAALSACVERLRRAGFP